MIINKTQTSSLRISGKERVAGVRAADGRVWDGWPGPGGCKSLIYYILPVSLTSEMSD